MFILGVMGILAVSESLRRIFSSNGELAFRAMMEQYISGDRQRGIETELEQRQKSGSSRAEHQLSTQWIGVCQAKLNNHFAIKWPKCKVQLDTIGFKMGGAELQQPNSQLVATLARWLDCFGPK